MSEHIPAGMPVLSAGKHPNPRRGACFMEFASYLAGERWSDEPKCTHPLLALIARLINDSVDDAHRARLVPLVPDVVGLNSPDLGLDALLAMRVIEVGLPIAPFERQRLLGAGLVILESTLPVLPDPVAADLRRRIPAAFATAPDMQAWGRSNVSRGHTEKVLRDKTFPGIAINGVIGVAQACVDDPQDRLVALLHDCIADARVFIGVPPPDPDRAPSSLPPINPDEVAARDRRDVAVASRLWSLVRG